ncbi:MAG: hypothetical protein A2Z03_08860 [Chloroflexi bacterium RBG_16_56_8]|nr:MAG: hypothetical protein A2Z03_08860 [Chloroflexi bacterium RBG_16_56_8]HJX10116.1 hypothetical protein [Candidatus Binatia bacterium]
MRNVRAKAVKSVIDLIGQNETPAVVIMFELQDGTGDNRRWTGWLTDAALERTIESLRHIGFTGNDVTTLDGCDCTKLLPSEVNLVLDDEVSKKDGKTYETIKWVNARGGTVEAKNSPKGQALAELKMRFKAAAAATAAAAQKEEPEIPFDDDEFANM